MTNEEYKHVELTRVIIGCFYKVYNTLGYGFLEKIYEKALFIELNRKDLEVYCQQPVKVYYENIDIGKYYCDLIVEDKIIVELKASETLMEAHEFQLLNYLKATDIEVGLLLNFGKKPQFKRKIFSNNQRKSVRSSKSAFR